MSTSLESRPTSKSTESYTNISFWPPRASEKEFDWNLPTNIAYRIDDTNIFTSTYKDSRSKLDYSYHSNPSIERQIYQDSVLSRVFSSSSSSSNSDNIQTSSHSSSSKTAAPESSSSNGESQNNERQKQKQPIIVFTSGPMGVGKSYVLSQLNERSIVPLGKFVKIDPDMLKSELPEMAGYLQYDSESAATKLHRESTQMSDVLFEHSLATNRDIIVDGSLRDVDWYTKLFTRIRTEFPNYKLVILYVSASSNTIKERARKRSEKTGRAVPEDLLQESIDEVPKSVIALCTLTDYTFEITNDDNQPMVLKRWTASGKDNGEIETTDMKWKEFSRIWNPTVIDDEEKDDDDDDSDDVIHCRLEECTWDPSQCEIQCELAKRIWEKSYPSFCPRCTILADKQCGICIHGNHRCYCERCAEENNIPMQCFAKTS
jgi:adenylylsulfate kinase-like enzyme